MHSSTASLKVQFSDVRNGIGGTRSEVMDTAIVTAMAGVLGSLVGGSASVAATWVTQRTLSKRELIRTEIRRREALYGEFISE